MNDDAVDQLSVFFLAEGEQKADAVMTRLTNFIRGAKHSLDFALYDMRFSEPLKNQLSAALRERAAAGVQVRICYDGDKPLNPNLAAGQDPAPPGTGSFVQSLGYPWRRIGGMKLMHHKFIVRDRESVWTGSTNMTDDAFTLMENNIVEIDSAALANSYAEDFDQLWEKENFENTGDIKTVPVPLIFSGNRRQRAFYFRRAAVWRLIRRLQSGCVRRSGVCGFAVCSSIPARSSPRLSIYCGKVTSLSAAFTIERKWRTCIDNGRRCRRTVGKFRHCRA